ncbi:hypothetical protein [Treponema sp.]|uniref:hypothetical protein n=1 Tax=Treponema sp. TaxID=166 RepID=UPI003FA2409C
MHTLSHHNQRLHSQPFQVRLPIRRFIGLIISCCAVFSIAACSSSAHIVIRDKADYNLTVEFAASSLLEKNITHLLKQKDEHSEGISIFNAQELKDSLTAAGIKVTGITLRGAMSLRIAGTVPGNHKTLKRFISYDRKNKRTTLRISSESIASFLTSLPQDSKDFIDMLMAPLFTGDALSPAEYEELIGSAYGKKLAAELRSAVFTLTIDVPYAVQNTQITPAGTLTIQKKTPAGSRAMVEIPLIDLLCAVTPIEVQL